MNLEILAAFMCGLIIGILGVILILMTVDK
jgi:hypothetical protein